LPRFWKEVRPFFHEYFRFWPDREDLIWAKSTWPIMEDAGFFADSDEDADNWTRRHIRALALLYAESAWRFGLGQGSWFNEEERKWLLLAFGSKKNLDEVLFEVGSVVTSFYPRNSSGEGDSDFFKPLIRSILTGSGDRLESPSLERYLSRLEERGWHDLEYREGELRTLWIGGHFGSESMRCLP